MSGVAITGIAAAAPAQRRGAPQIAALFGGDEQAERVMKAVGIRERRVSGPSLTAGDLGAAAAKRLFEAKGVDPAGVDGVVFVSQYPDLVAPATACLLQERLGVGQRSMCFDVNQGCAGYVHGLAIGSSLIHSGVCSRLLLVVADTPTKTCGPTDKSTVPLFGDAGTATLLERSERDDVGRFAMGNDGAGWLSLTIPLRGNLYPDAEAFACFAPPEARERITDPASTYMDGEAVFKFCIERVPALVADVLEKNEVALDQVDHVVLHQANAMILEALRRKLRVPKEKFVLALERFGNTASATIPLALVESAASRPVVGKSLVAGFGVGLSWAGACVTIREGVVVPEVVDVGEP